MRKKLKVVVTGGSGFIGSHVCLRLLNKGHEVICLDNLSTGCKKNMLEFLFNPLFHFVVHDITSPFSISGIDVVIHCATPDLRDPLHFLKTCSYGAFTAAGIARRNNAKLICLSSSDVCEDNPGYFSGLHLSPDSHSTLITGLRTMEEILLNYSSLDIKILRLYDVYGPKMKDSSVIYEVIHNIVSNKNYSKAEIPFSKNDLIYSCYVDDVINAICCSMEMDFDEKILNVGSSEPISIFDLVKYARISSEFIGVTSFLENTEKTLTYGAQSDTRHTLDVLHWKQKIPYSFGISKLVDYIKLGPSMDYEEGYNVERTSIDK